VGSAAPVRDVGAVASFDEVPAPEVLPEVPPVESPAPRGSLHHADGATHTHDYPVPASHDATPHDPRLVHLPVSVDAPAPSAHPPDEDVHDREPHVDAPAHFALSVPASPARLGPSARGLGGAPGAGGASTAEGRGAEEPVAESAVDEPARCITKPALAYPEAAERAGIEAEVPTEIVVDAQGRVSSVRVLARAGFGLDAAAERGVRAYRFSPAKRRGAAVAVRMKYFVKFELR
jgi:protein TonB